jgi:hypothetical protein
VTRSLHTACRFGKPFPTLTHKNFWARSWPDGARRFPKHQRTLGSIPIGSTTLSTRQTLVSQPGALRPRVQIMRAIKVNEMDISKYCGSRFLKVEDVREPVVETIAGVVEGKYDKPDLIFESGNKLSLNKTNASVLRRLFGKDTDDAVGAEVELYVGTIAYQGDDHEAVLIRLPDSAGVKDTF